MLKRSGKAGGTVELARIVHTIVISDANHRTLASHSSLHQTSTINHTDSLVCHRKSIRSRCWDHLAFIKHVLFVTETHAFFTTDKLATMPARGVMLSLKFESKLDWSTIAKKIEDGRAAAREIPGVNQVIYAKDEALEEGHGFAVIFVFCDRAALAAFEESEARARLAETYASQIVLREVYEVAEWLQPFNQPFNTGPKKKTYARPSEGAEGANALGLKNAKPVPRDIFGFVKTGPRAIARGRGGD